MRYFCQILSAGSVFALLTNGLRADPPASFRVSGAVITPATWDVPGLKHARPADIRTLKYTLKGQTHTAHVVSLWTLVQAAQPRLNPQIKNHAIQFFVLIQGRDGYTAAFSLGELTPEIGSRAAWVALDEDGKPLADEAGPAQLIVPGDKKPDAGFMEFP